MSGDLDLIADLLSAAVATSGRALIAVDGIGASGKSTLAADLVSRLDGRPTVLLHADDFFHPPAVRHARGRLSPEGFWLDTYDYDTLTRETLDPLRSGNGRCRLGTASTRPEAPVAVVPENAVVMIEGTFLHRDRLQHYWDFSIFLDVPFEAAARRMVARGTVDGPTDPRLGRYFGAQRLYFQHAHPWERASIIVDSTAAPVIVEAAHHARRALARPARSDPW